MNVALITADRPLAHFGKLAAAILNARIVARLLDHRVEFEVLHHAAAPDEKLIVSKLRWPRRLARDAAVLNAPQLRIAIPTREVLAVEQRAKAIPCPS